MSLLAEVIRRVVKVAQPEKIVLFGSAARGATHSGSDLDLLVIKAVSNRRRLAGEIYKGLVGVGCAVDIVVATPDDLERYGHSPALVFAPALREGKVIYAA